MRYHIKWWKTLLLHSSRSPLLILIEHHVTLTSCSISKAVRCFSKVLWRWYLLVDHASIVYGLLTIVGTKRWSALLHMDQGTVYFGVGCSDKQLACRLMTLGHWCTVVLIGSCHLVTLLSTVVVIFKVWLEIALFATWLVIDVVFDGVSIDLVVVQLELFGLLLFLYCFWDFGQFCHYERILLDGFLGSVVFN